MPKLALTPAKVRELRNVAIVGMTLSDIRLRSRWALPRQHVTFDSQLTLMAYCDSKQQRNLNVRPLWTGSDEGYVLGKGGVCLFSRDGRYLVSEFPGGRIRLWRLADRKFVLEQEHTFIGWQALDFSFDGGLLAIGDADGLIHLYDTATAVKTDSFSTGMVRPALSFEPANKRLAVIGETSHVALLYNLGDKTVSQSLTHPSRTRKIAWHPKGELFAVSCADFNTYIWNTQTEEQVAVLRGHEAEIMQIDFCASGELLASRSWDGTSRVWDAFDGREIFPLHDLLFRAFHSGKPQMAAVFEEDNQWKAGVWDVERGREFKQLHVSDAKAQRVWSLALDHDGDLLAATTENGVYVWHVGTGKSVAHLYSHATRSVVFTPGDGSLIVSGGHGVEKWPREHSGTGQVHFGPAQQLLERAEGSLPFVGLSGNGRFLACVGGGKRAVLLDLQQETARQLEGNAVTEIVAVSKHGDWVAAGLPVDKCVRIWNGHTGAFVCDLPTDDRSNVEFCPDDKSLLTCTPLEYRYWDIGTWRRGRTIGKKMQALAPTSMSRDGSMLAITENRWLVNLLDPDSGTELAILPTPESAYAVGRIYFSGDSQTLAATVQKKRQVLVWNLGLIRERLGRMGLDW